jgi:hypothetical protein
VSGLHRAHFIKVLGAITPFGFSGTFSIGIHVRQWSIA